MLIRFAIVMMFYFVTFLFSFVYAQQKSDFEILRKFTKALGFRASQYVETPWEDDSVTSRKPETIELRFRAVSGSDQILVQKDDQFAIKLKDLSFYLKG